MQSETADFAPGAASWRIRRNIRVVSDSAHSVYCENMTWSRKPKVHNVSRCGQRRTERTKHLVKFGRVDLEYFPWNPTDSEFPWKTSYVFAPMEFRGYKTGPLFRRIAFKLTSLLGVTLRCSPYWFCKVTEVWTAFKFLRVHRCHPSPVLEQINSFVRPFK